MAVRTFNLGIVSVIAIGIGSIVGAGIFALLGQVIVQAGSLTYAAFLIAGALALLVGYSYAKLAAVYPDSGGLTDYFHHAFPAKAVSGGFTILYWLTNYISVCMLAKSFGLYLLSLFPHAPSPALLSNGGAAAIIALLALLNMAGTQEVGKTEVLLVTVKIALLIALAAAALIEPAALSSPRLPEPSAAAFFKSIGITFFAFAGFGVITNAAADVPHPRRTIAAGIYLTLIIVTLLYLALAAVVIHNISPAELLAHPDTAITTVAEHLLGRIGHVLIYVAAAIAFITGISASFFSTFRISRALADQNIFPAFYREKFWRRGSFGNAISVLLTIVATIAFDFNDIVTVSSGAYLVSYLAVFMANWKLRAQTKPNRFLVVFGFLILLAVTIGFIAASWS